MCFWQDHRYKLPVFRVQAEVISGKRAAYPSHVLSLYQRSYWCLLDSKILSVVWKLIKKLNCFKNRKHSCLWLSSISEVCVSKPSHFASIRKSGHTSKISFVLFKHRFWNIEVGRLSIYCSSNSCLVSNELWFWDGDICPNCVQRSSFGGSVRR